MENLAILFAFNYFVLVVVIDSKVFFPFHIVLGGAWAAVEDRGRLLKFLVGTVRYLSSCYLCLGFWVALLLSTGVCAEEFGVHLGTCQRVVISGAMAVLGEAASIATKVALKRLDR